MTYSSPPFKFFMLIPCRHVLIRRVTSFNVKGRPNRHRSWNLRPVRHLGTLRTRQRRRRPRRHTAHAVVIVPVRLRRRPRPRRVGAAHPVGVNAATAALEKRETIDHEVVLGIVGTAPHGIAGGVAVPVLVPALAPRREALLIPLKSSRKTC